MTASAQRTPVSLLFSMSIQHGWTPEYDLTSVEGASHDPTFTYVVKVHDVTATASGQSKRKAKHSAAKSALEQLLSRPEIAEKGFMFEDVAVTTKNLDEIIVEPVSETAPVIGGDSKNSVGVLQEHCTKHKITPPYYETIHESGPPHDKTFLVQCMIEKFVTEGEGKTKRLAKRVAAQLMLDKLQASEDKEENCDQKIKVDCEDLLGISEICIDTPDSKCEPTSAEILLNLDSDIKNEC